LEALKAKAENDPAKKAEIEKQLEGLGKQIEKLAENKAGLEKALQKANLDPKLAGNKEALERALENAKGLTEQQKQDIRKAAEAQQRAQEKMQEMSKACNGACDKPGGQKSGGNQGQSKSGEQGEKGGQKSGDGKDGEKQQGGKGESGQTLRRSTKCSRTPKRR
jgi:chromosome segregation ATPase